MFATSLCLICGSLCPGHFQRQLELEKLVCFQVVAIATVQEQLVQPDLWLNNSI